MREGCASVFVCVRFQFAAACIYALARSRRTLGIRISAKPSINIQREKGKRVCMCKRESTHAEPGWILSRPIFSLYTRARVRVIRRQTDRQRETLFLRATGSLKKGFHRTVTCFATKCLVFVVFSKSIECQKTITVVSYKEKKRRIKLFHFTHDYLVM